MRLTLRTLLAWLDDTLEPTQVREIGRQVKESPLAQELAERIHRVTRQRRLTVPPSSGPDGTDPNIVASYLDNDLDPESRGRIREEVPQARREPGGSRQRSSNLEPSRPEGEGARRSADANVSTREGTRSHDSQTGGSATARIARAGHQADSRVGRPRGASTAVVPAFRPGRRLSGASLPGELELLEECDGPLARHNAGSSRDDNRQPRRGERRGRPTSAGRGW